VIALARARGRSVPDRGELLSIGERSRYLLALRIGLASAPVVLAAYDPGLVAVPFGGVVAASSLYLFVAAVPHMLERRSRKLIVPVIQGMLLLDGIFLAGVIAISGGATSHLRFLPFAHVIGVTLLFSYPSGLKLTLWHTLLFLLVVQSHQAGILYGPGAVLSAASERTAIVTVAALWLSALGTATFSALSERELRRQKADLERLSAMLARIQAAGDADEIARLLLGGLCETFTFSRAVVLASPDGELALMASTEGVASAPRLIGPEPLADRARSERGTIAVQAIDPGTDPGLAALLPGATNVLIVPLLIDRGRSLGLIAAERGGREHGIRRWVVAMVGQFASHGAFALSNAWLSEERRAQLEEIRVLQRELEAHNADLEAKVAERTKDLRMAIEHLEETDRQRRRLLDHVVSAGEEERRRIANDLHDDPVQKMVALKMRLELLDKTHPGLPGLPETRDAVLAAIRSLRHLLFDLRPPILEEKGLAPALRSFLENSEADFDWSVEDELTTQPSPQTRLILYRIAQEALTNARKHSKANRVTVRLYESMGGLSMEITDDGVGFEPQRGVVAAPGHMGLAAIRERAEMSGGRCELHSLPGEGTTLDVWMAMSEDRYDSRQDILSLVELQEHSA
jgi:signal transduction histidine kinase